MITAIRLLLCGWQHQLGQQLGQQEVTFVYYYLFSEVTN